MKFEDLSREDKMKVFEAVKRRPLKRAWRPQKELQPILEDIGCEFYKSGKNAGRARMIPLFLIDQIENWIETEYAEMYSQF